MYTRKYEPPPPISLPEHYAGNKFRADGTEAPIETVPSSEVSETVSEPSAPSYEAFKPQTPPENTNIFEARPGAEPTISDTYKEAEKATIHTDDLFSNLLSPDMLLILLVFLLSGNGKADEVPTILMFLLLL